MECKHCKKTINDDYSFCPHCGNKVVKEDNSNIVETNEENNITVKDVFAKISFIMSAITKAIATVLLIYCIYECVINRSFPTGDLNPLFLYKNVKNFIGIQFYLYLLICIISIIFGIIGYNSIEGKKKAKRGIENGIKSIIYSYIALLLPAFIIIVITIFKSIVS